MRDQLDPPDPLAPQVREVRLGPPAPSDPQEDPAPRAPPEMLERRESPERKDRLGRQGVMESKAQWVYPVQLEPQGFQGRTETRVRLESTARRGRRVTRESMDLPGLQDQWVHWVSLVPLELMGSWEPGGSRGLSGPREMKAPEDSQGPLAPSVCRDFLDLLEKRERRETWDPWVLPDPQDPVDLLAPMALMVPKVLLVVLVTLETSEKRESLVRPDPLELEESQERRALVESVVTRERRDNLGLLDLLVEEDPLETTGLKETLVLLVSLAILVPLVKSAPEVKMEQREREERTVNKDKLVLLDLPVKMDPPAHLERGV